MSKDKRERQDLVVVSKSGPGRIRLTGQGVHGVRTTIVTKGILYVHDRKGCLLAQFAKGEWLYAIAADTIVTPS